MGSIVSGFVTSWIFLALAKFSYFHHTAARSAAPQSWSPSPRCEPPGASSLPSTPAPLPRPFLCLPIGVHRSDVIPSLQAFRSHADTIPLGSSPALARGLGHSPQSCLLPVSSSALCLSLSFLSRLRPCFLPLPKITKFSPASGPFPMSCPSAWTTPVHQITRPNRLSALKQKSLRSGSFPVPIPSPA